jgi:hypothetical protein
MSPSEAKILLTVPRSAREDIVVAIREYKGRRFVDFRVWYEPREGGAKRPGKEGVTMPLTSLRQLAEAFTAAQQDIEANDELRR